MMVLNRATMTGGVTLTAQITHLEVRILDRRQLIRRHAASYRHVLWNSLTSPVTLLSAGGLGFLVGLLTRRQASAVRKGVDASQQPRKLVDSILKLIGVVRTFLSTVRFAFMWLFPRPDASSNDAARPPRPAPR